MTRGHLFCLGRSALDALESEWRHGNPLGSLCRRLHWLYNWCQEGNACQGNIPSFPFPPYKIGCWFGRQQLGWMKSGQDASASRGPSADFLVPRQRVPWRTIYRLEHEARVEMDETL